MRVLVVDDHPTDLKLISHLLTMSGHVVFQRPSSEGVLDFVAQDRPDVVLVDLRMPGTDGVTLIRQLRGEVHASRIPIVAVTAFPDSYSRSDLMAAGCNGFLLKPLDTRTLSEQIEAAVRHGTAA
jgi:CheY-like chemotaxis protein